MAQTKFKAQQMDDTAQAMLYSNAIINGACQVAQRVTAPNLSTTSQYGAVDRFRVHATGTAVSAGTIAQSTSANAGTSGYALRVAGATITGTGVVIVKHRIEARDARSFKNLIASFAAKVYHDVGSSINYTITIRKATAADNFASVTDIQASSAQAVANTTATTIKLEGVSMGDCSNGIEIEISVACGAVTTKNFEFTEFQFNQGYRALAFLPRPFGLEHQACQRYYEKSYEYATAPGTNTGLGSGIVDQGIGSGGACYVRFRVEKLSNSFTYSKTWDPIGTIDTIGTEGANNAQTRSFDNFGTQGFKIFRGSVARVSFHWVFESEL